MFTTDSTAKVVLSFEDKGARVSRITIRYPFSSSRDSILTSLLTIVPAIEGISDAVFTGYRIFWHAKDTDAPEPEMTSDIYRLLTLFYRNESVYEEITIPSPNGDIFDNEGPYSHVRMDPANASVLAWTVDAAQTLGQVRTEEDEPFPVTFVAGGKVL